MINIIDDHHYGAGCGPSSQKIDLFETNNEDAEDNAPFLTSSEVIGADLNGHCVKFPARQFRISNPTRKLCLSNTSFYRLLAQVENSKQGKQRRFNTTDLINDPLQNVIDPPPLPAVLWAEKYRPKKFTDLFGVNDEHVKVLQWINGWSRLVMGNKTSTAKRVKWNPERDNSTWHRSILMIHGPPGLGKTTLAHIAAHVGGFQSVEINASDERGGDVVIRKIQAAMESDSILAGKPNLLIIDEIDGAATGGGEKSLINLLVKLSRNSGDIGTSKNTMTKNGNEEAEEKKKKGAKTCVLNRPIICICNDLYVAVLRQLRKTAQIIALQRPNPTVLVKRLAEVALAEGLKVDRKFLFELAETLDCDVRACLNALQFISHSPGKYDAEILKKFNDTTANRSHMAIYESIFYQSNSRDNSSIMINQLEKAEDYDQLTAGVFELYLQSKFYDDMALSKVNCALEWLSFSELCTPIRSDGQLAAYHPYAMLKCHKLFASPVFNKDLKYPRHDYERYLQTRELEEILSSYQAALQASHKRPFVRSQLLLERLPCVLKLIDVTFRVVLDNIIIPPINPRNA